MPRRQDRSESFAARAVAALQHEAHESRRSCRGESRRHGARSAGKAGAPPAQLAAAHRHRLVDELQHHALHVLVQLRVAPPASCGVVIVPVIGGGRRTTDSAGLQSRTAGGSGMLSRWGRRHKGEGQRPLPSQRGQSAPRYLPAGCRGRGSHGPRRRRLSAAAPPLPSPALLPPPLRIGPRQGLASAHALCLEVFGPRRSPLDHLTGAGAARRMSASTAPASEAPPSSGALSAPAGGRRPCTSGARTRARRSCPRPTSLARPGVPSSPSRSFHSISARSSPPRL
jgi:hypothetical protein